MGFCVGSEVCIVISPHDFLRQLVKTARRHDSTREMLTSDHALASQAAMEILRTHEWWKEYYLDNNGAPDDIIPDEGPCHSVYTKYGIATFTYILAAIVEAALNEVAIADSELSCILDKTLLDQGDSLTWETPSDTSILLESMDTIQDGEERLYIRLETLCSHYDKIGRNAFKELNPVEMMVAIKDAQDEYPDATVVFRTYSDE